MIKYLKIVVAAALVALVTNIAPASANDSFVTTHTDFISLKQQEELRKQCGDVFSKVSWQHLDTIPTTDIDQGKQWLVDNGVPSDCVWVAARFNEAEHDHHFSLIIIGYNTTAFFTESGLEEWRMLRESGYASIGPDKNFQHDIDYNIEVALK